MQNPASNSNDLKFAGIPDNALKAFQLSGDANKKTDIKFGERIVLQCENIINSGYFTERNARFALNRSLGAGKMDMVKFMDFLNINGKTNYVNINWKSIMIVNTIISRLVGRWMTQKQKASVTATDPISIKAKKDQQDEAEFYMDNKEVLLRLQSESGLPTIPQNSFIPEDKDHLDLWAAEEQRLPEEILNEKGINNVLDECGWNDVLRRRILRDSAEVGLIGTETIADSKGKIIVNYCKPENMFYSYSEYDDFRDADIKGEIVSYKISQLRNLYPHLKAEELFEISKASKQWQANSNITFDSTWNINTYLPIDDWNVDVVRFTLKSLDNAGYEMKVTKSGNLVVDRLDRKPANDSEYVERKIWNIYRGVYIRSSKKILEWGLEKNMIKPQDYEKISEVSSPYSFYMYQNVGMRNLAVPEKIEEPVEQMILARLKIQQLVAKLRPSGYQYDIDGMQAMDLGNGIVKPLELQKITDQTGNVYFRSRDAEGNRIETPVKELPNAGSVQQLQALIEIYNYHLQVLRDEIGINEFAEGQTIKPRVGVQNVETALEVSFNATDYIRDAVVSLMNETADKIACLLHDSVEFGSEEYRKILKEENVKGRNFKVKIDMLPTTEEVTQLMKDVDQYVITHPDFILYISPFKIREIAKENTKLANLYFERAQKKALEGQMQQAQAQSEMNAKQQQASNEQAAQKEIQLAQDKLSFEMKIKEFDSLQTIKQKIIEGSFQIASKSQNPEMPAWLLPIIQQVMPGLELSLGQENQAITNNIQQNQEQQAQNPEGMQPAA